jgi:hypothetical protein
VQFRSGSFSARKEFAVDDRMGEPYNFYGKFTNVTRVGFRALQLNFSSLLLLVVSHCNFP